MYDINSTITKTNYQLQSLKADLTKIDSNTHINNIIRYIEKIVLEGEQVIEHRNSLATTNLNYMETNSKMQVKICREYKKHQDELYQIYLQNKYKKIFKNTKNYIIKSINNTPNHAKCYHLSYIKII